MMCHFCYDVLPHYRRGIISQPTYLVQSMKILETFFKCLLLLYHIHVIPSVEKSLSSQFKHPFTKSLILLSKTSFLLNTQPSSSTPISFSVENSKNILEERFGKKKYQLFRPGKQNNDIFYPLWFQGLWNTSSVLKELVTPLGVPAFGGDSAYASAVADFNNTLHYVIRFKVLNNGFVLNDRLFNIEEIAKSSIGSRCIIDDSQKPGADSASEIHLILSPPGTGGLLYDVDLYCTDRLQQQSSAITFDTLERTSQSVSLRRSNPPPVFRKEIETLTLYTKVNETVISAKQRTATYLSPLDPRYNSIFTTTPLVASLPIDVRTYQLTFTKLL